MLSNCKIRFFLLFNVFCFNSMIQHKRMPKGNNVIGEWNINNSKKKKNETNNNRASAAVMSSYAMYISKSQLVMFAKIASSS